MAEFSFFLLGIIITLAVHPATHRWLDKALEHWLILHQVPMTEKEQQEYAKLMVEEGTG